MVKQFNLRWQNCGNKVMTFTWEYGRKKTQADIKIAIVTRQKDFSLSSLEKNFPQSEIR